MFGIKGHVLVFVVAIAIGVFVGARYPIPYIGKSA
jgi:hypothetical protein